MGRKRKTGKHLPKHVYVHGKSYRYRPPGSTGVRLGPADDYAGMLRALAGIVDATPAMDTMAQLLNRYEMEITPRKAATNQASERRQLANLRKTFGEFRPQDFQPHHAASYRDARAVKHPRAANHELGLLSHVFTKACEWGAVNVHPIKGMVRKVSIKPRRRYPTDAEFNALRAVAPPMLRYAMDLALLTGLRRGDILALEMRDIGEDGLYCHTSKTDVAIMFEWTEALREVVDKARKHPPRLRRTLVCNTKGKPYTKNAMDSLWQRAMAKYKANGGEPFQFRDLRRKSASDDADGAAASARLGHTSQAITERVYRVKPKTVRPLR